MNAQSMNAVEFQNLGYQPTLDAQSSITPMSIDRPAQEHRSLSMLAAQANMARRARHIAAASGEASDGFSAGPATVVRRLLRREAVPG